LGFKLLELRRQEEAKGLLLVYGKLLKRPNVDLELLQFSHHQTFKVLKLVVFVSTTTWGGKSVHIELYLVLQSTLCKHASEPKTQIILAVTG
jgi:hypothetical protein